jgi:non-specific serine/threonine protein kinase
VVPDYFEKFIKDIAKKSRHKRHGFFITQTAVRSCNLQLVHDFLKTPTLSVFYLIMTDTF